MGPLDWAATAGGAVVVALVLLDAPEPDARDVRRIDSLRESLDPDIGEPLTGPDHDQALNLAARQRITGDMLERLLR